MVYIFRNIIFPTIFFPSEQFYHCCLICCEKQLSFLMWHTEYVYQGRRKRFFFSKRPLEGRGAWSPVPRASWVTPPRTETLWSRTFPILKSTLPPQRVFLPFSPVYTCLHYWIILCCLGIRFLSSVWFFSFVCHLFCFACFAAYHPSFVAYSKCRRYGCHPAPHPPAFRNGLPALPSSTGPSIPSTSTLLLPDICSSIVFVKTFPTPFVCCHGAPAMTRMPSAEASHNMLEAADPMEEVPRVRVGVADGTIHSASAKEVREAPNQNATKTTNEGGRRVRPPPGSKLQLWPRAVLFSAF